MKLDLTVIKNESTVKFAKSCKKVRKYFDEMLMIALDTSRQEIDDEKRQQVEIVLGDMLNDEFSKALMSFTKCMNKAGELIENDLGS